MRKRVLAAVLAGVMCMAVPTVTYAQETEPEGAVVLAAADASFTEGEGISLDNVPTATVYDEEAQMVVNLEQDGSVTYMVPEGTEGKFDVYLTVSKMMAQFTSQPFSFSVNEGEAFSVPLDCQVSADSPAAFTKDGEEYNTGTLMDKGRFQIMSGAELKSGDTIEVIAS